MGKMTSKKPNKKRRELYKDPLHRRRKKVSCRLSDSLHEQYHRRSLPVCEGDQVEVMRGEFIATRGSVSKVDLSKYRVVVDNVTKEQSKGGKIFYPLHPSNLMITRLNLDDSKRKKIMERT